MAYPVRAIVVEASWHDLEGGHWLGQVPANAVTGSVLGWIAMGIPVVFGHNAHVASRMVSRMLYIAARRRYKELLGYMDALQ